MQFGKKDLLNIFNWYTQWIDLDAGHPCKTLFFFLIMQIKMNLCMELMTTVHQSEF